VSRDVIPARPYPAKLALKVSLYLRR
jgi:hypothetical protein